MKVKKLIQALVKEEMDPRRPKDKAFDLAQQLSKLSPEDREKVAMIQQMISKERGISGMEDPKTGLGEMKVTDKDGNDVTSDIIKKLEKSLKKSGYTIGKTYKLTGLFAPVNQLLGLTKYV